MKKCTLGLAIAAGPKLRDDGLRVVDGIVLNHEEHEEHEVSKSIFRSSCPSCASWFILTARVADSR